MNAPMLTQTQMREALHAVGDERYHIHHPFHRLLHDGGLNRGQVQAWALNRYYYQSRIPMKDATLLARLPSHELRRAWRSRLEDHDGVDNQSGGVARWLKLTEGLGLDPTYVQSTVGVLAGTRFATDAYIAFVRERPILEAIASSLTEMFSPAIISERVAGMLTHYDFVRPDTLTYFTPRLTQAPKDVEWALAYVYANAHTREDQDVVLAALRFKCDVLWSQLDALHYAYVEPGRIPPGAFVPSS